MEIEGYIIIVFLDCFIASGCDIHYLVETTFESYRPVDLKLSAHVLLNSGSDSLHRHDPQG